MKLLPLLLISTCAAVSFALPANAQEPPFVWKRVNIGGGGMNTGLLFHPKKPGVIFARQDVSGLLRWNETGKRWEQCLDFFPVGVGNAKGCDGFALSVGDSKTPDMVFAALGQWASDAQMTPAANGLYRSADSGRTWKKIWSGVQVVRGSGRAITLSFGSNLEERRAGEPLFADPVNPDLLYIGTRNAGLWCSSNARTAEPTFTKISNAPEGFTADDYGPIGIRAVLVDPRGGTLQNPTRSKIIFVGLPHKDKQPDEQSGVFASQRRWRDLCTAWWCTMRQDSVSRLALTPVDWRRIWSHREKEKGLRQL